MPSEADSAASPERLALQHLQGRLKKNLHLKRPAREPEPPGENAEDAAREKVDTELVSAAIKNAIGNFKFRTNDLMDSSLFRSKRPIVLGVTSAIAGEGKTTIALHLAINMARSTEQRVCLMDMSLSENSLSRQMGMNTNNRHGLVHVLEGTDSALSPDETIEYEDLSILPAGKAPDNASRAARSPAAGNLLTEVRDEFDVIIVDLPAITSGNVAPIARHLDAMMVVVNSGATPKETVAGALERLDQSKVLGLVLNHIHAVSPS